MQKASQTSWWFYSIFQDSRCDHQTRDKQNIMKTRAPSTCQTVSVCLPFPIGKKQTELLWKNAGERVVRWRWFAVNQKIPKKRRTHNTSNSKTISEPTKVHFHQPYSQNKQVYLSVAFGCLHVFALWVLWPNLLQHKQCSRWIAFYSLLSEQHRMHHLPLLGPISILKFLHISHL